MIDDQNVIEGQASDIPQPEAKPETEKKTAAGTEVPLKSAWKQVENIGQALGDALQGRGNVVMVRVNDEALSHLDMLVEAEIVKSRSEAAALLINEGIKSNEALFGRISEITQQITQLRSQLRESVRMENQDSKKEE